MKKILPIILFFICILSGTVFAADISIENAVIDRDTQVFSLSGTVTPDASADEAIIMLLKPGKSAAALETVADITDFNDTVAYFRQIALGKNGSFEVSAYINNQSQTIDNTADEYTLVISRADFDAPYIHSEKVKFYTQTEVSAAIDAVNKAADSEAAAKALADYAAVLDIDLSGIDGFSQEGLQDDEEFVADGVLTERTSVVKFTKAEQIRKLVSEGVALYAFDNADTEGRVSIISDNGKALGISELSAMKVYSDLSSDGKTRVAAGIKDAVTIDTFTTKFTEQVILSAVQYLPGHTMLPDAFSACQAVLTEMDMETYLGLDDTSEIDKDTIGESFDSISELVKHVNDLIDEATSPKPSKSSGGSPGGGSPSIKYDNKKEETPPETTPAPVPENEGFTDLQSCEWAREAIESLSEKGVISGRGNGIFDPDATVKREEFAKMIVLAFNLAAEGESEFSDVSESDWFYPYVSGAAEKGIINGMNSGTFGTGMEITRQDMAVMIYRAAKNAGVTDETEAELSFNDADKVSDYAKQAVAVLTDAGVINGTGNGNFSPANTATRAQAAKMIFEAVNYTSRTTVTEAR